MKSGTSIPNLSWNWKPFTKSVETADISEDKVRTHRSNSQKRQNNPLDEISEDSYKTICLGDMSTMKSPMYHNITLSQTQHWMRLEEAILEIFERSGPLLLRSGSLVSIHEHVRHLLDSNIGSFVYDRYNRHILKKGMAILRQKLVLKANLIDGLCDIWVQFYSNILPALDSILYRVKAKCGLTVRQTTLIAFRDEMIFETSFEDKLKDLSVYECYPPSKNKIHIELLTALTISPYMGYKGLYLEHDISEVAVPSREPHLNAKRKSIDLLSRSLSRPLTMQPKQLETLKELFATAIKKIN
ncbi:unnamed protein product [Medioppia subpectinata]|uniref:Uncharacterized protein n=1 Tax=Medioppia subpectinata TaxID=1979941 RepID=A0A7R9KF38_9ACAR|nr:unnamed protein product [Medioppia subpectinata]CAG2101430.1 unnamed protein product [Medioppia subpectinata]